MAIVKLWRFAFMTRTVMGFLASSFNLGAAHAPADAALRRRHARRDTRREQPAPAQGACTGSGVGELDIPCPPGWRMRHASTSGITEYFTLNLRTGIASFVVPPAVEFDGPHEEFQRGLLRRISEGMPVAEGSTRTGTVGSFRFVSCTLLPPWGAPRRIVLYTARWAGKGQLLLFGADCEQLFHDHLLGVHALVQKIVVPNRQARFEFWG